MEYHNHKFIDASLLIFKNDKLISLLPANIIDDKLYSHQGLSYGGFILNHFSKLRDIIEIFKHTLEYLNKKNIKTIYYKSIPNFYTCLPSNEDQYVLFILNAKIVKTEILSVVNKNSLFLSKDRKSGVKRGQSYNLKIVEVDDFKDFWNSLLIKNLNKKYNVSPVHSLKEITQLKRAFKRQIRQFNVYMGDNLIAGSTIFETNSTAHVQYISSDSSKNKSGSLDYLFYYLITDIFKNKDFFDFGNSHENDGKNINEGLIYWKEGFGSQSFSQNFYEIETKTYKNLDNIFL